MNYRKYEVTYPSADGKSRVFGVIYAPVASEIRGVLQVAHGMVDYTERYEGLADYLCARGFALAGNHHLGHGRTALTDDDLGYFADKDATLCVLRDMHQMNRIIRERFPSLPVILLGHSMGSFLSRLYCERYPHTIAGHIIHATGGPHKILLPLGRALTSAIALFRGKRHRSVFIAKLAFSGYNSKFDKSEGILAWLTRDVELVNGRFDDKYTNFIFTLEGYNELFKMIASSNSKKWFAAYPKNLKTLIMSGDMDPVGDYGKGVKYVYKHLLVSGCADLTLKLYEGARHELFNETCKEECFLDIFNFLNECIK